MKLLNTDTLEEAREKLWKETADMELETCEAELREARGAYQQPGYLLRGEYPAI